MNKDDQNYCRTVLIIDDEPVNRQMLGNILEKEYRILYAENGRQALEQLQSNSVDISLIFLDLIMPELDGYTVLQTIRENALWRKIPVIVLTSDHTAEVRSLQLGASDFLSKPYDLPEVILARARHSIDLFEGMNIIRATENDALTGLYTREFFFEYAHQYDHRNPDRAMDAIVLNFNHFHLLNELYGRTFGDRILKAIAQGIRAVILSSGGIACRYDADAFYLYTGHQEDYEQLLSQVISGFRQLLKAPEIRLRMGVYPDIHRTATLESRFARALQACNLLRNQYAVSFAVYDEKMHEKEVYSARLLEDFERALEEKQFLVSYQPKYNIRGDRPVLCSAEALVSWLHPEFGRVSPGVFIPLFEENGLIQRLDRYVWQEAAAQIKKWRLAYQMTIPVSVNVSRVDIYDPEVTDFLLKLVEENQIDPHNYLLEITESAYTDDSRQIIQVVKGLRDHGFRVEMDDFGSGYSSLNMLTELPIDALKLDMAFIRNISPNNKEMRMVELVLEIADFLKVPVIAEGVENREQYELLKKADCDIIQGYYFSRPIPPKNFNQLIEKEKEQCADGVQL